MSQNKGGRPPLTPNDTTTKLTVRVPTREFDRACQQASRERIGLSDLVRRGLTRVLRKTDDDADD